MTKIRHLKGKKFRTKLNFAYFKHLSFNRNTGCNTLRGNYDGTLFPRNISKNEVFKYYRKCFCRTLPIEFTHEGMMDGVEAYWFKLADHAFESRYDDPETACFCKKKQCMKKGLGNITPCYWSEFETLETVW